MLWRKFMSQINVLSYVPEAQGIELSTLQMNIQNMSDDTAKQFLQAFNVQRKTYSLGLIFAIFLSWGVFRLWAGDYGFAIVQLLTFNIVGIGWIIDLVQYKDIIAKANANSANMLALNFNR